MSQPTGVAPTSRPAVVPIVLGLLLVAAVIAVALLIERATDEEVELPDTLVGGFRADRDLPAAAKPAESDLAKSLGEDVTLSTYTDAERGRALTVTVVEAEAGPFAPDGPQPAAESLGLERTATELIREGDAICQVSWGRVIPVGEKVPEGDPIGVFCQAGGDARTYWLNAQNVSVDDAFEMLDELVE